MIRRGVTDRTLTIIKERVAGFLTDTCTLEVESNTRNALGHPDGTWNTVAIGVNCRLIRASLGVSSTAEVSQGVERLPRRYRLICESGTALAVDQRVTLDSDGTVYRITGLVTDLSDNTDVQAIMEVIQPS